MKLKLSDVQKAEFHRKKVLEALDQVANPDGIADIRRVAAVTGLTYEDINKVVTRTGFRRVTDWIVNTKVINA